jgi:hypothetical protein
MAIVCTDCGSSRRIPLSFTLPGGEEAIIPDGKGALRPRPIATCVECGRRLYPGGVVISVPSPKA